tara:strand:+ start:628 stop:1167 length:540 start_codon:yes stop_codon:yes gene_type:complete
MAKSRKYEKNLAKIQDMLDGNHGRKIVVGDASVGTHPNDNHKVGDKWIDSDGIEWEQKQGYRSKVRTMPNVGLFSKVCKDCKKNCSPNKLDKDTWVRMERCYHCQINFEALLQTYPIKYWAWMRLQVLTRWEAMERDMEQLVEERYKELKKRVFDKSVANALANSNVDTSMKVNKNLIK